MADETEKPESIPPASEIPEELRTKLLGLLGDLRLFKVGQAPMDLTLQLMLLTPKVAPFDEKFANSLTVLTLGLFPPQPGEVVPDGLDRVCEYWFQESIKRLGGTP